MEWYYRDGDKQVGPVAEPAMLALIKAGVIGSSTPVWRQGMADWSLLKQSDLATSIAPPPHSKQLDEVSPVVGTPVAAGKSNNVTMNVVVTVAMLVIGVLFLINGNVRLGAPLTGIALSKIVFRW
jgi:hypothetical protein